MDWHTGEVVDTAGGEESPGDEDGTRPDPGNSREEIPAAMITPAVTGR